MGILVQLASGYLLFQALVEGNFWLLIPSWILWVFGSNLEDNTRERKIPSSKLPDNWQDIRNKALLRDDYKCGNCGGSKDLNVHHIVPKGRGGTHNLSNLKTLCKDCHKKVHPFMSKY